MNKRYEQLSGFHDDALSDNELSDFLRDLKQDPVADAETVFRYNLIGDVLRDDVDVTSFMDISASVHRAIAVDDSIESEIENVSRSINKQSIFASWLRPLSGMAIAASVAMITVVAFRTIDTESGVPANLLTAETQTRQDYIQVTDVTPVNADLAQQVRVVSVNSDQQDAALRTQQLNEYMLEHYAGQSTVQGMIPYVRVASYGSQVNR
ncbi:MAG: sigma-E factor negative regulatory protein [Gammaproteobacteria bacterium]|nr:sigma-E factor negative regulatory protein [Gammaproteobacteria bacterium]